MPAMSCLFTLLVSLIVSLFTALYPTISSSGHTIPIPKNKNVNVTRSDNCRGIMLSSVIGRILDNIIMHRLVSLLASCDLQFGFKRRRSTAMCTAVVKEVAAYYTQQVNSNVFCTFLDASKAFAKVHYCKLFSRLIERNVPPLIIRVLLNTYSGQHVRVLWNGIFSCNFPVKNGVKQGGIISPILFCIYFDDVLCRLQDAGLGCFIGHYSVLSPHNNTKLASSDVHKQLTS
jgi:hypothetical protein